jgi:hypothetical protein
VGAFLVSGAPLLLALCLCAPSAAVMMEETPCHRGPATPSLGAPCCCAPFTLAQSDLERPLDLRAPERPRAAGLLAAPAALLVAAHAPSLAAPHAAAEPPPAAPPAAPLPLRA